MNRKPLHFISSSILVLAGLLAACSAPAPAPTNPPQPTAMPTARQAAPSMPQATSSIVLDPCQLLDSSEAQKLTGVAFGAGVESTTPEGGRFCTYGANTKNVLTVTVGQAATSADAQAFMDNFLNDIKTGLAQFGNLPLTVTQITDFGSGAVSVTLGQNVINLYGSAFGFRKNTNFFGFSDLVQGSPAPTPDAMRAEAAFVLGELP